MDVEWRKINQKVVLFVVLYVDPMLNKIEISKKHVRLVIELIISVQSVQVIHKDSYHEQSSKLLWTS